MIAGAGSWAEDDEMSGAPGSRRAQRVHLGVFAFVVAAVVVSAAAGVVLVVVR